MTLTSCKSTRTEETFERNIKNDNFFQLKPGIKSYFKETTDSVTTPNAKFCDLQAEKKYYMSGRPEIESGHYRIAITNSDFTCGFKLGYVFSEHVNLSGEIQTEINSGGRKLSVPYFCQLKNQNIPSASCSNTALAMVLAYHGKPSITGKGTLADQILLKYGVPNSADRIRQTAINLGFKAKTLLPGTMNQIKQEIDNGRPVIVGADFVGNVGHFIVITGYDERGFFVNDPYGYWDQKTVSPYDGYKQQLCNNGYSGEKLHYSYEAMQRAAGNLGLYLVFIQR